MQKYKNTKNKILNSNKNIVEKNRNMENAIRITFFIIFYTLLVGQSNVILMILLTNQLHLESQKPLVTLFTPEKK